MARVQLSPDNTIPATDGALLWGYDTDARARPGFETRRIIYVNGMQTDGETFASQCKLLSNLIEGRVLGDYNL